MFFDGSTTRLGNDVGGSVIKALYSTTFDVLRMMEVQSYVLNVVDDPSVYGSHKVDDVIVVELPLLPDDDLRSARATHVRRTSE